MSILRRSKSIIQGLQESLESLKQELNDLKNGGLLTEEQQTTLSLITATMAVDLDKVVTQDRLASDISDLESDTLGASVTAIREYVLGALQVGGPQVIVETLPVSDTNTIALNNLPHSGINGVLNYSCVRYTNDGVDHELPLSAIADDNYRFTIDPNGFDLSGQSVKVQYLYHYDPRDLNTLIGELILEGLVLISPEENEETLA